MNWMARNLIVVLFGAASSIFVAGTLVYLEATYGETLFGFTLLRHLPAGAIITGCLSAAGFLLGSLVLNLRPGRMVLIATLSVSALMVFMIQSAEFRLFLGGSAQYDLATKSTSTFGRFLFTSMVHTPLRLWSDADSTDDMANSVFFSPGKSAGARVPGGGGDPGVDGISGGVQGMMATQDVSQTSTGQQMNQMGMGIQSVGSRMKTYSREWLLLAMQTLGFSIGGLAAFCYVRSLPHCKDCMLLLSTKGARTRYFSRSRDMQSAVDDFMVKAREKQLQESIESLLGRGADRKASWAEFSSTIEIELCTQCRTHRLNFSMMRKEGKKWRDVDLFGFTGDSLEPLYFA